MGRVEIDEISVFEAPPACAPFLRGAELMAALQTGQAFTAEELAGKVGVDKRTLRRYIQELRKTGFEIEAKRGAYGSYQLKRGKKLPPLLFNDEELEILLTALNYHFVDDEDALNRKGALTRRINEFVPWQIFDQIEQASKQATKEGISMWYEAKAAREAKESQKNQPG